MFSDFEPVDRAPHEARLDTAALGDRRLLTSENCTHDQVENHRGEREDDRRPDRCPEEMVDREMARDRVDNLEQGGVHDDREQPERNDHQGQRQQTQQCPENGIDNSEQRRDPEVAPHATGDTHPGKKPARERKRTCQNKPANEQCQEHGDEYRPSDRTCSRDDSRLAALI